MSKGTKKDLSYLSRRIPTETLSQLLYQDNDDDDDDSPFDWLLRVRQFICIIPKQPERQVYFYPNFTDKKTKLERSVTL